MHCTESSRVNRVLIWEPFFWSKKGTYLRICAGCGRQTQQATPMQRMFEAFSCSECVDGVALNAVLSAYVRNARADQCIALFETFRARAANVLNANSFAIALSACDSLERMRSSLLGRAR